MESGLQALAATLNPRHTSESPTVDDMHEHADLKWDDMHEHACLGVKLWVVLHVRSRPWVVSGGGSSCHPAFAAYAPALARLSYALRRPSAPHPHRTYRACRPHSAAARPLQHPTAYPVRVLQIH